MLAMLPKSDDADMGSTRTDGKLDRLVALGACATRDALVLGRHGDLSTVTSGTVLRTEGHHEPWSYCVLAGTVLLSAGDEAVAVAGKGAWLLGQVPGYGASASPLSIVAGTDVELLCFRPRDLGEAMSDIPGLLRDGCS